MQSTPILCSTIIPTIGRSSLAHAVESALGQSLSNAGFEVIVVNDSGNPLPEADWQKSELVQIFNTNKQERSVARNTGAAAAKGRYLHFLDDDDFLVSGAYQHLSELSQSSSAKWLYGMTQIIDRQHRTLIQLRHHLNGNCFIQVMSGEWIPLQSSWIDRETFMRIGGFNPLLAAAEDVDLLRRMLLHEEVAETPNLISHVIMGVEGSSTDYVNHPQWSRWARESILDLPESFTRMSSSATTPMWRGRMTRIYLTSAVWNLQRRRFFTALSRLSYSIAALLRSAAGLLRKDFWEAVVTPYASLTFERGQREADKQRSVES
jgi:glycosyltransferase involved in cell wall biosynthesis